MDQNFIRAHSDKQKAVRISQIIDKTLELYNTIGYDKITFSKISEGLSFSRINLYNYFKSKEEIFLEIIRKDSDALLSDVKETLNNRQMDLDTFVKVWADLITRHERVVELYALMNSTILRNVSSEKLLDFQLYLDDVFVQISKPIKRIFPFMTDETALHFSLFEIHYAMGLQPIAKRFEETGIRSVTDPGNFRERYADFLAIILKGFIPSAKI